MKACRVCGRLYPDDAGFCPTEGQALEDANLVPVLTDATDQRVGRVLFDRYQLRRVVADGGMGRVYEAIDLSAQRNVAVKLLHPDVSKDGVAVERFRREFEVSQYLSHRHVVDVVGFHAGADGTYAIVMEFLYGEELRATLKREKCLAPGRALRMLSQVAQGLGDAHERKLVHRDLKPDNIFLCQTKDGDISKILDFGSVKDKAENAKKLTALGTTIGSPYYMSPEQAQGLETLDSRADVWALGAIFYECITGAVPFNGNNGPSILLEILTKEPIPPNQVPGKARGTVPPALDAAIARALTKVVANRTPTVSAFADAVGHAYGLAGTHQDWATMPESEIEQQIAEAAPRSMKKPVALPTPQEFWAAEEASGLGDGIDAAFRDANARSDNPPAASPAASSSGADSRTSGTPSDYAIPTDSFGWVLPTLAVSLVALVLVVVIYVVR